MASFTAETASASNFTTDSDSTTTFSDSSAGEALFDPWCSPLAWCSPAAWCGQVSRFANNTGVIITLTDAVSSTNNFVDSVDNG